MPRHSTCHPTSPDWGRSFLSHFAGLVIRWMGATTTILGCVLAGSPDARAGQVVIEVTGDLEKTVLITGDNSDNVIDVQYEAANGALVVATSAGSGTTISGETFIPMSAGQVIVNMGSGHDTVRLFTGTYGEAIDYVVLTQRGDDSVVVLGQEASLNNLEVDTGDGADSVYIETLATGSVAISTGDGKDWVGIARTAVGGDLLIWTGRQNDTVILESAVSVQGLLGLAGDAGGQDAVTLPTNPQDLIFGTISLSGFEESSP